MSRVNFVETITLPQGPGGSLIPVSGIAAIPYTVNPDQTQGSQAVAYTTRSGSTEEEGFLTDSTGSVSYWIESGDYNVVFSDPQSPPRITTYTRGFNAAEASSEELLTTGDTKFSFQAADHGLNADGSYQWLLVTSAEGGTSRLVPQATYMGLWNELGTPDVDGDGNFPLPNISGRQLVAAGAASGLTSRALNDMYGGEEITLTSENLPSHTHGVSGTTNGESTTHTHGVSGSTAPAATDLTVDTLTYLAGSTSTGFITCNPNEGATIVSAGVTSNVDGVIVPRDSDSTSSFGMSYAGHGHGVSDPNHSHSISITSGNASNDHNHSFSATSDNGTGTDAPVSNLDPSYGMNLFVKT